MNKFLVLLLLLGCQSEKSPYDHVLNTQQLQLLLKNKTNQVVVVNFWATTCKPCLKEMPHFQEAYDQLSADNVSFYMLSLDDSLDYYKKAEAFRQKAGLTTLPTYWLNAPMFAEWLDLVDENYWGSMPATLIFNGAKGQREFILGEISRKELFAKINSLVQNNH